jgi:hypothetical protein
MRMIEETRFVERLKFFDGQRLFAADLQGLETFNREMRWLHNQSLHQPGIGRGYAISGAKGDRQVTIGPGYAIDADGREIVLTRQQVIQVPPVSGDEKGRSIFYDLTVAYQDTDLEEVEFRDGICDTRGAVRLREAPIFCWVPLERDEAGELRPAARFVKDIQDGYKIILARAEVLNCRLQQVISIAQRQSARPDCGPYIACGTADSGLWKVPDGDLGNIEEADILVLQADIDTHGGVFQITPCYSAHIPGPRLAQVDIGNGELSLFLLIDFLRIVDSQLDHFRVLLFVSVQGFGPLVDNTPPAPGATTNVVEEAPTPKATADPQTQIVDWINNNWTITWMGVEG